MYILGRDVLQNEEVCLICTAHEEADPSRNWAPCNRYAICLPKPNRLTGYIHAGGCDLRFDYNENLYYGGHIGYHIDEPYRGNHLALKACRLLLEEAWRRQMPYIYITCNPDNIASRRTLDALVREYNETGRAAKMLKIVDLPEYNDMYLDGERQKCIFCFVPGPGMDEEKLAQAPDDIRS
ncbi:MAG: GNAT family N-acetyltransferase [Firmicutes bacterium]|nr:GNAT family N-acetyltransferase [Bacillota bacterium]